MSNMKKFSCGNCNHPYEAYPPDDVYTIARLKECFICKYLNKTQIKRIVECENCDQSNTLFWHIDYLHTVGESNEAKRKRDQSRNINLGLSHDKSITLDRG